MLSNSERLYILIVHYGLARDAEYEDKIKRLQGLIVGVMLTCKIYCSILYLFLNGVRLCLAMLIYLLLSVLVTFDKGGEEA